MGCIANIADLEALLGRVLDRYYPRSPIGHDAVDLSGFAQELTRSVKDGDPPSIEIACEIIEADPRMPFGKLIKSNLARALRQQSDKLLERDRECIVTKTIELLGLESCPREAEDYCKLVRKLGVSAVETVAREAQVKCEKSKALVANLAAHGT